MGVSTLARELRTEDGISLAGTLSQPGSEPLGSVVIASALGVPRRY